MNCNDKLKIDEEISKKFKDSTYSHCKFTPIPSLLSPDRTFFSVSKEDFESYFNAILQGPEPI